MKKQQVTLALAGIEDMTVMAYVKGNWGIHHSILPSGKFDKGWTITDTQSGFAIVINLKTKRKAVEVVDLINRYLPDFNTDNRKHQEALRELIFTTLTRKEIHG